MSLLSKIFSKFNHYVSRRKAGSVKVLVIGLAKSGTSILMYRIANGLKERREYFEPRGIEGQLDIDFHTNVCQWTGNVVTKIVFHPNRPHGLKEIMAQYDRVVWIVRDPRDQFISSFFYVWYKGHDPDPYKYDKALAITRQKETAPSATPFYEMAEILYRKQRFKQVYEPLLELLEDQKEQFFLLHYEDFIDGNLQDLHDYLGFSIDEVAEVRNRVNRVARSKAYGNWRRWFTPEDVEYYKAHINSYLEALAYDPDDWALETVEALPAKEGSEYMERMFKGGKSK